MNKQRSVRPLIYGLAAILLAACEVIDPPSEPDPRPTTGVLLEGSPSTPAVSVTSNFVVPALLDERFIAFDEQRGADVLRTEVFVLFDERATVAEVNDLLASVGGLIVSMARGVPAIVVEVPDPGSLAGVATLVEELETVPIVLAASPSPLGEAERVEPVEQALQPESAAAAKGHPGVLPHALPDDISPTSADDVARTRHHMAIRTHAAWNLRSMLPALEDRPWLVVADSFGDGPPDADYDLDLEEEDFGDARPFMHGYHVLGIVSGVYGPSAGDQARDDVTGTFPGRLRLRAVDLTLPEYSTPAREMLGIVARLVDIIEADPDARIVVNTSLNDREVTPEERSLMAFVYAASLRDNGLVDQVVHLTSAGNSFVDDGVRVTWDAEDNSLYAYAAFNATSIPTLAGMVEQAALPNVLVIENRESTLQQRAVGLRPMPGCARLSSILGGHLSAIGTSVYSFGSESAGDSTQSAGGASMLSGTSMATPQVAGVAALAWAVAPDLTGPEVADLLVETARDDYNATVGNWCHADAPMPVIDALDSMMLAGGADARIALLNVSGGLPVFDHSDVTFFLDLGQTVPVLDYSRADLNGDGVTDQDPLSTFDERLDLDADGVYGTVSSVISGAPFEFDELALTDLEIMCFGAYSALFTGNSLQRAVQLPTRVLVSIAGPGHSYLPLESGSLGEPVVAPFELNGAVTDSRCGTPARADPSRLEWRAEDGTVLGRWRTLALDDSDFEGTNGPEPRTITLRYEPVDGTVASAQVRLVPCSSRDLEFEGYPECPFAIGDYVEAAYEMFGRLPMGDPDDVLSAIHGEPRFIEVLEALGTDRCDPRFCDPFPAGFPLTEAELSETFYGDRGLDISDYLDRLFKSIGAPTFAEFEQHVESILVQVANDPGPSEADKELFAAAASVVLGTVDVLAEQEAGGADAWRAFGFARDPSGLVAFADVRLAAQLALEGYLTLVVEGNVREGFDRPVLLQAAEYASTLEAFRQARLLAEEGL